MAEKINATRGRPYAKGVSGNPKGKPAGTKNRAKHLGVSDTLTAADLVRKGISESDIAKVLHARPEAVKEALGHARKILEALSPEVAKDWVNASRIAAAEGDHKPAMALLQSIEVVKPIAQTYDTGAQGGKAVAAVKVELHGFTFAGLPTQPTDAAEPKTIDVTASTTP